MSKPKLSFARKLLFIAIALLIPVLLIFAAGEITLRVKPQLMEDPPPPQKPGPPFDTRVLDDTLGWHVKPNYYWSGELDDISRTRYPVTVTTNAQGFRFFANHTDATRLKVLFIGDSYTESVDVGDSALFYNDLQRLLPIDVYAYGSAGYGTTQELMVLQKYFDLVKPDIVVLQTCTNDFQDNNARLEELTHYKVGKPRPYTAEDGEVFYDRTWEPYEKVRRYSWLLYYIGKRYENVQAKARGITLPYLPGEQGIVDHDTLYPPFNQAVKMTGAAIRNMKHYLEGKALFITYTADDFEPATGNLKRICQQNTVIYLDGVGNAVWKHQEKGEIVRAYDGYHWNNLGHQIIAQTLAEKLQPYIAEKASAAKR